MKCKNRFFAHIRQQWIDWFTSNRDHNDHSPAHPTHIIVKR